LDTTDTSDFIAEVELVIDTLKEKRKQLERVIVLFQSKEKILDQFTAQYISIYELKNQLNRHLIKLSNEHLDQLTKIMSSTQLEECLEVMDQSLSQLIYSGHVLTIRDLHNVLNKIDSLIIELMSYVILVRKGDVTSRKDVESLIVNKVMPIWFGLAIIAIDVTMKSWASILGGLYTIYAVTTVSRK
jgi:hypothetical protein